MSYCAAVPKQGLLPQVCVESLYLRIIQMGDVALIDVCQKLCSQVEALLVPLCGTPSWLEQHASGLQDIQWRAVLGSPILKELALSHDVSSWKRTYRAN